MTAVACPSCSRALPESVLKGPSQAVVRCEGCATLLLWSHGKVVRSARSGPATLQGVPAQKAGAKPARPPVPTMQGLPPIKVKPPAPGEEELDQAELIDDAPPPMPAGRTGVNEPPLRALEPEAEKPGKATQKGLPRVSAGKPAMVSTVSDVNLPTARGPVVDPTGWFGEDTSPSPGASLDNEEPTRPEMRLPGLTTEPVEPAKAASAKTVMGVKAPEPLSAQKTSLGAKPAAAQPKTVTAPAPTLTKSSAAAPASLKTVTAEAPKTVTAAAPSVAAKTVTAEAPSLPKTVTAEAPSLPKSAAPSLPKSTAEAPSRATGAFEAAPLPSVPTVMTAAPPQVMPLAPVAPPPAAAAPPVVLKGDHDVRPKRRPVVWFVALAAVAVIAIVAGVVKLASSTAPPPVAELTPPVAAPPPPVAAPPPPVAAPPPPVAAPPPPVAAPPPPVAVAPPPVAVAPPPVAVAPPPVAAPPPAPPHHHSATARIPTTPEEPPPAPRHHAKHIVVEDDGRPGSSPTTAPAPPGEDPAQLERAREAYRRGNQKLFSGNHAGAISAYQEALQIYPGYVAGYRGLGLAYAEDGNTAEALKALHHYVQSAPNAHDVPIIKKRIDRLEAAH